MHHKNDQIIQEILQSKDIFLRAIIIIIGMKTIKEFKLEGIKLVTLMLAQMQPLAEHLCQGEVIRCVKPRKFSNFSISLSHQTQAIFCPQALHWCHWVFFIYPLILFSLDHQYCLISFSRIILFFCSRKSHSNTSLRFVLFSFIT